MQSRLFDDDNEENEDDLIQKVATFEQAVVWGTDWTTETITNQLIKQNIDLKPKFQRRDAWTKKAKSKFIESLFLGLPIPQIILAERKDQKGKYIVIDGKQRLLTIRSFFAVDSDAEFSPLTLTGLDILNDLNGKRFSQIQSDPNFRDLVDQIMNMPIRTTVIKNWPNESFLFTVFLRLNTGSAKLSPQELRQALHPGEFIDFVDQFSVESAPIKRMLGLSAPDFRMRDMEIVIRYYCFRYYLNVYDGNLKTSFDKTVKYLNDDWCNKGEQIKSDSTRLEKAIEFIIEKFGEKNSFSKYTASGFLNTFNRSVFDIMVYYFSQDTIISAARGTGDEIVETFKRLCLNNIEFLNSLEQTTKSIQNTYLRLNIWGEALATVLNIKIQVPYIDADNRMHLMLSTNG